MRFSIAVAPLKEALSNVQKAINAQNTLPVLGNILVRAEQQKLYLCATNLEIAISTSLDAQVQNEGSITIPSRLLVNYISLLSDEEVEVKLENGDSVHISSKGSSTKIKGLSAEEFPELPEVSKDISITLDGETLKKSIEQTVFSCSSSSTRPVLSGVLFWIKGNEMRLVGTDSYRLGEKKIELSSDFAEEKYIVPSRTLQELSRILSKDEPAQITISKNQILFTTGNTEISSRLIEGNFPDYERIIPPSEKGVVKVSKSEMVLAVKRAGIFAREVDNNNVKMRVEDSSITITTEETEIGSGSDTISAEVTGEGELVALNASYLLDVLQVLSGEDIIIKVGEALSPVKFMEEKSDAFVHIIMPLKV